MGHMAWRLQPAKTSKATSSQLSQLLVQRSYQVQALQTLGLFRFLGFLLWSLRGLTIAVVRAALLSHALL